MDATSPIEKDYVRGRVRERDRALAQQTIYLGALFNAVALPLILWLADAVYARYLIASCGFCFTMDALWILFLRSGRRSHTAPFLVIGLNLVTVYGFAKAFGTVLILRDPIALAMGMSALMALTTIMIVLSPFSDGRTALMAVGFWLLGVLCTVHNYDAVRLLVVYTTGLVFSTVARGIMARHTRENIVLEYRAQQANLRLAQAKMQHEVDLAREIQDSMTPPARHEFPGGTTVACMQRKFESIGGDWLAIHRWDDGTLVAVVVDATGKGMQAALVVHAIQSLWAMVLDEPAFDAAAWLARVNVALHRLGEKQAHSATIGVVVLAGVRLTYWSAGHPPLFVLLGADNDLQLRTLSAQGTVLGLGPTLDLSPRHIDVALTYPMRIMLFSDGVVEQATRVSRQKIVALFARLKSEGDRVLEELPADDDKTLIIIERATTTRVAA